MQKQEDKTKQENADSCLEALRAISPETSSGQIEELVAGGLSYLEWVKGSNPCNTSLVSRLRQEIMRAQFLLNRRKQGATPGK